MIDIQLTALAKARVWFHRASPKVVPAKNTHRTMAGATSTTVAPLEYIAIEGYLPRGGRAEYGMLGFFFQRQQSDRLDVDVPYSEEAGVPWPDALASRVDDVRLGLLPEFVVPIIDAIAESAAGVFPCGRLIVSEAAHGAAGSSAQFFQKIVFCAVSLMLDGFEREPKGLASLLTRELS